MKELKQHHAEKVSACRETSRWNANSIISNLKVVEADSIKLFL